MEDSRSCRRIHREENYEMEEFSDPYNPHLDYMQVTLGRTTYDCVKVILDGKCIYNNYDDDKVEANG